MIRNCLNIIFNGSDFKVNEVIGAVNYEASFNGMRGHIRPSAKG